MANGPVLRPLPPQPRFTWPERPPDWQPTLSEEPGFFEQLPDRAKRAANAVADAIFGATPEEQAHTGIMSSVPMGGMSVLRPGHWFSGRRGIAPGAPLRRARMPIVPTNPVGPSARQLAPQAESVRGYHAGRQLRPQSPRYPLGRFQEHYSRTGTGGATEGYGTYIAGAKPTAEAYYGQRARIPYSLNVYDVDTAPWRQRPGRKPDVSQQLYPLRGAVPSPPHMMEAIGVPPTYEAPTDQIIPVSALQSWTHQIPDFFQRYHGELPSWVKDVPLDYRGSTSSYIATQFLANELPMGSGIEEITQALQNPSTWENAKRHAIAVLEQIPEDVRRYGAYYDRPGYVQEGMENVINALDRWPGRPTNIVEPRALYRVEAMVPERSLLDLDRPLSDQEPHLLRGAGLLTDILGEVYDEDIGSLTGKEAIRMAHRPPDDFSHEAIIDPEELSDELSRLGIPGSKYLDQYSRGGGEGTRNYVIFDPQNIRVLNRLMALVGAVGLGSEESQEPRVQRRTP
jgi:hypothetical protein